jgi:hypothetical protein
MGGSYYDPEEENHCISILCRCKTSVKKYIQMSVYCHVTCFCLLMGGSSMTHSRRITDYLFFPTTFDYLTLFFFFFLTKCCCWRDPVAPFSCCYSILFVESCYSCWLCITQSLVFVKMLKGPCRERMSGENRLRSSQ